MRASILTAATLSVAALTLSQLAPASADSIGTPDPQDLHHGVDLRAVVLKHRADDVVVITEHTNLRPTYRSGSAGAVFLDTDPSDPGPEYVFAGGYFEGTDYVLLHTDGFSHATWGEPVDGSYTMRVDYDRDEVRMRIDRDTLGSPERVRVAVRVAGLRSDGKNTRRDWLGGPRSFTEWVAQ